MLLYESMLDSVLSARDRFLRPSGLMAPSQTRIVIAGITADGLIRDRSTFWDGVYGKLSSSAVIVLQLGLSADRRDDRLRPVCYENRKGGGRFGGGSRCLRVVYYRVYHQGGFACLRSYETCSFSSSTPSARQDIDTHTARVDSLEFQSNFILSLPTSSPPRPIRAFTTWFDTFFASSSSRQARPDEDVQIHRFADTAYAVPVAVPEDRSELLSFTTGPRGKITHWKQVTFMLKKEVVLEAGEWVV